MKLNKTLPIINLPLCEQIHDALQICDTSTSKTVNQAAYPVVLDTPSVYSSVDQAAKTVVRMLADWLEPE